MKLRINMTIGPELHKRATRLAASREMSFSELVSFLLRKEIGDWGKSACDEVPPKAAVPREVTRTRIEELTDDWPDDDEGLPMELMPGAAPSRPLVPPKPARNVRCPCGSGDKFKRCCEKTWPVLKNSKPQCVAS